MLPIEAAARQAHAGGMRYILLALFVVGCGETEASDPLAGTAWTAPYLGAPCDYGLAFYANGNFMDATVCTLSDGSLGAEVNKGVYSVEGGRATVDIARSSCPTGSSGFIDFRVIGDTLKIDIADGVITMQRLAVMPGEPGAIPFGCYDADFNFTPMPLHQL